MLMPRPQKPPLKLSASKKLNAMVEFLKQAPRGDVVEVGVFQGGSLYILATNCPHRHFFGYDTFEGLCEPTAHDNFHKKGEFKSNYKRVLSHLAHLKNVTLIKGVYPQSDKIIPSNVIMAHVDVDLYEATRDSLLHLAKIIKPKGRIYCDDAYVKTCQGATKAYEEACRVLKKPTNSPHAYIDF